MCRIHEVLIRQKTQLIFTIITNIVAACLANDPQLRYLSKKQNYYTEVYSYQIEVFGEITHSFDTNQIDHTQLVYLYDFRLSDLVGDYVRMVSEEVSKHTDTSFLRKLMQSLIILILKSQQVQDDLEHRNATVLTLFDIVNHIALSLTKRQQ